MRRFLRRVPDGGGKFPIIDPLSLPGAEVYLRSDQTNGTVTGSNVTQWFDLSGNNRTFNAGAIGANTPTLRAGATPTGQPLVRFDGGADPNGDFMNFFIPVGSWPDNVLGYTFYFIGDFLANPAHANGEVIFSDQTNGRPQLILNGGGVPSGSMGWRDTVGFHLSGLGAFENIAGLSLVEWVFTPGVSPLAFNGGTDARVYMNGREKLQSDWSWNAAAAGPFMDLGMGPLVFSTAMDLGLFLWFSRAHTLAERVGIRNFFKVFFGQLNA